MSPALRRLVFAVLLATTILCTITQPSRAFCLVCTFNGCDPAPVDGFTYCVVYMVGQGFACFGSGVCQYFVTEGVGGKLKSPHSLGRQIVLSSAVFHGSPASVNGLFTSKRGVVLGKGRNLDDMTTALSQRTSPSEHVTFSGNATSAITSVATVFDHTTEDGDGYRLQVAALDGDHLKVRVTEIVGGQLVAVQDLVLREGEISFAQIMVNGEPAVVGLSCSVSTDRSSLPGRQRGFFTSSMPTLTSTSSFPTMTVKEGGAAVNPETWGGLKTIYR